MITNSLFYGDNLVWLRDRKYFPDESVDLIYLDPPFNSKADYNLIFNEINGSKSQAQIKAFADTWNWDSRASVDSINELAVTRPDIAKYIEWLQANGTTYFKSLAAYLSMMSVRLIELHRVLNPRGSLYLHCDPNASHYLKTMLDLIFGSDNFRNEIIWQKVTTPKAQTDGFGNVHDSILFYSKSHDMVFNEIRTEHRAEYLDTMYRYTEQNGRRYRLHDFTQKGQGEPRIFGDKTISPPPGKHWIWSQDRIIKGLADGLIVFSRTGMPQVKRYLDVVKGHRATDIWMDVKPIGSMAKERLPYPTQKPLALLERIIEASSNEDDTVLDPFCGCGTTIEASQKLERHWMGIDVTWLAISLVESRLKDAYKARGGGDYKVYGNPIDFSSAQKLAIKSKREFELWAISLVEGAFPRREYDGGVDGIRGFREKDKTQTIVIQVKGGDVLNPGMVRDLHGTVSNERAAIGLLVSLKEPTKGMRELAAHYGDYKSELWNTTYPQIQIRTVEELLAGKQFEIPPAYSLLKEAKPALEKSFQPPLDIKG